MGPVLKLDYLCDYKRMECSRKKTELIPDSRAWFCVEVSVCELLRETIMEGQMHENGPLYTSVLLVMCDEGG